MTHKETVTAYIEGVLSGEIIAGRLVKLAVRRHLADLEHAEERGFYFDEQIADEACNFFPAVLRHSTGGWADQPFELTPCQTFITWVLFGWRRSSDNLRRFRRAIVSWGRKNGKGLALDTPLPTPSGWTTMGDLKVGDELFDPNGIPCKVTRVSEDRHTDCYRITFSNREQIVCDGDHLWVTSARQHIKNKNYTSVRDTRELARTVTYGSRGDNNHSFSVPQPLSCPNAELTVDPYVLGVWLGDGHSVGARFTTSRNDKQIVENIRGTGLVVKQNKSSLLELASNYSILLPPSGKCRRGHDKPPGVACRQCERERDRAQRRGLPYPNAPPISFSYQLRTLGVLGNKHIPPQYLRASFSQRLALLQGLMDTDGTINRNGRVLSFDTTSTQLRDGVSELLASMGVKHTVTPRTMRCNRRDVPGLSYRIQFMAFRDDLPVFRLNRKLQRMRNRSDAAIKSRSKTIQITGIESVDTVTTRCIEVDSPSHQFLCGRTMIPTHNSTWASGIALMLLTFDNPIENGAQVYVAATKEDQAKIMFREAVSMVEKSPSLSRMATLTKNNIAILKVNSFFRPLGSDSKTNAGWNPHAVLLDELCDWQEHHKGLWGALTTASGARRQPLRMSVCTAGDDTSEIWQAEDDHAVRVLESVVTEEIIDDTYFAFIARIDDARTCEDCDGDGCDKCDKGVLPADDPLDEECWEKANPNIEHIEPLRGYLREQANEAAHKPTALNDFIRYHCNRKASSNERAIKMDLWRRCKGDLADWSGMETYGAFDLGRKTDLASIAVCCKFASSLGDQCRYEFRQWSFTHDEVELPLNQEPWATFERHGSLLVNSGNVIDLPGAFKDKLLEVTKEFNVLQWAFDPHNAGYLGIELTNTYGMEVFEFRQTHGMYNEALDEFLKCVKAGTIRHGDDPLLTFAAQNLVINRNSRNEWMPAKPGQDSIAKIDPIVCAIMAFGGAMKGETTRPWTAADGILL